MSHSSDDDSADEPEIQYGIRRSRRSTSYEYRDSSSLALAERMEQETYYNAAKISLERSFLVMHVVCVMNALYQYFARLLQHYLSWPAAIVACGIFTLASSNSGFFTLASSNNGISTLAISNSSISTLARS
jgi:hypothetical protein